MAYVTEQQLSDAAADCDSLEGVVNGGVSPGSITTRLGATIKTISRVIQDIYARLTFYNHRGAWATATAYAIKDTVLQAGIVYVAMSDHTSGTFATDLAAGKWAIYQGITGPIMESAIAGFDPMYDGALGNGSADDTSAIVAANARGKTLIINKPHKISGAVSVGKLYFGPNGKLIFAAGTVLTVGSIFDTRQQIFDNSLGGSVVLTQNWARPDWWGSGNGTILEAIYSLPTTGGEILFSARDYNNVGRHHTAVGGPFIGNEKPNIKLRGAGMPVRTSDGSRFVSGSGTVIQGSFINFANGFEAYDLGVDVGPYVTSNFDFGGFAPEGFVPCTHKFQGTPNDLTTYIQGVAFGNIRVIAVNASNHALLCEFGNGINHGYVECEGGFHGYVCKSTNVRGGKVWAYGQQGDAYIIKSDQYTHCNHVEIESISIGRQGFARTANGYIQSTTGGHITGQIQIGRLHGVNCKTMFQRVGDDEYIVDVNIGQIFGDDIVGDGVLINGKFRRVQLGKHIINNTTGRGISVTADTGMESINIGSGSVTNADLSSYLLESAALVHGDLNSVNSAEYGFQRGGNTIVDTDRISGFSNTLGLGNSLYELLKPSDLVNGWVIGSSWPFQVVQVGRTLHVRGTVSSGTSATIAVLPVGFRPGFTLTFITAAITSAGVRTFAHVDILPTGEIQVSNLASLGTPNAVVALNFNYLL